MTIADKNDHTHHISQQFNKDLSDLKSTFLRMGGLVEQQVSEAVTSLINGDAALADTVRKRDNEVDNLELQIDEECVHLMAMRHPAASDLRLVISVVKMVGDLERIGDEASKIAKMTQQLGEEGEAPRGFVEVRHIGESVREMVKDALDSFARYDTEMALSVMKRDKSVDQEYKSATRSLVTFMMEDPRSISRIMSVMWVLRALERIGDHACNVAEHVIYTVNGKDVRHTPIAEAEKVVEGER